jgi:hypothetical protein
LSAYEKRIGALEQLPVSHAAAFFLGMSVGAIAALVLMTWSLWRLRNGPRPRTRAQGWVIMILVIVPPIVIAFSMPDFKTALIAWFGFPTGMTLARVLTLPLMYLGAQRIEKRLKQGA